MQTISEPNRKENLQTLAISFWHFNWSQKIHRTVNSFINFDILKTSLRVCDCYCPSSGNKTPRWCVSAHQSRILAIVHPTQSGEVCRFCTIEAMVEACVVSVGKSDHKLPFILSNLFRYRGTKQTTQLQFRSWTDSWHFSQNQFLCQHAEIVSYIQGGSLFTQLFLIAVIRGFLIKNKRQILCNYPRVSDINCQSFRNDLRNNFSLNLSSLPLDDCCSWCLASS